MNDCTERTTSMDPNTYFDDNDTLKQKNIENKPYRELIVCLMYIMLCIRPDISAALNFHSRYQNKPSEELNTALKGILRYLKGTLYQKWHLKDNNLKLIGFADSDLTGDTTDRKSTSRFMFKVTESSVCWSTKDQSTVATLPTDTEYIALFEVAREGWLCMVGYT